jgi:peptidoglycan/xylan/chitin deacetylase (PgdA/CDA1 family)
MHDVHRTTVDAVPRILDTLAGRGYHFVTVSELFWPQKLSTDDIWSHRRNANGH